MLVTDDDECEASVVTAAVVAPPVPGVVVSSKNATPITAKMAPIHCRVSIRLLPVTKSRRGTTTTANEQRKADLLAGVVSNPTACATYPIEFQRPTSNPNHVAIYKSLKLLLLLALNSSTLSVSLSVSVSVSLIPTSPCFIPSKSHGSVTKDANENRSVKLTPSGIVSPNIFTSEKLVPYNAAAPINRYRAFHILVFSSSLFGLGELLS
mmetsp:Transcript_31364/g.31858  ORF Transcript_31364/g.31858 Transcript_31364/m.31858 type:complete len:209 (-) Transcript_31364:189-815(-)